MGKPAKRTRDNFKTFRLAVACFFDLRQGRSAVLDAMDLLGSLDIQTGWQVEEKIAIRVGLFVERQRDDFNPLTFLAGAKQALPDVFMLRVASTQFAQGLDLTNRASNWNLHKTHGDQNRDDCLAFVSAPLAPKQLHAHMLKVQFGAALVASEGLCCVQKGHYKDLPLDTPLGEEAATLGRLMEEDE